MKYTKYCLVAFVLAAFLVFLAAPPSAMAVVDEFHVKIGNNNELISGGGSGYDEGTWYYYPNTKWWNEWFYNAPFDPTRWKEIDVEFTISPTSADSWAVVTINWSTPEWSALGNDHPPLPENVDQFPWLEYKYIARAPALFADELSDKMFICDEFDILDYNPEWVSIDVMGQNFEITDGWIDHRCVPIPSAVWLLGSGLIGLVGLGRRKLFEKK
jgi:hypothetical protein